MQLEAVTVIIRSVGERTEALCKQLIADQGVSENAIFVVNEAPFSQAMKVGFEIALAEERPWTHCVDADVLLRKGSIANMLAHAERQPDNICEIQGFVLDKFFGGARKGGVHLYRTALLDKAIRLIPPEGEDIRPETHTLNAMQAKGHPWRTVRELVGLHDFEQRNEDIFRKCFVHAHKNLNYAQIFLPWWLSQSLHDADYKVAVAGFAEGLKNFDNVRIDIRQSCFQGAVKNFELDTKGNIVPSEWSLATIDRKIEEWIEPVEYVDLLGDVMAGCESAFLKQLFRQYLWYKRRSSAKTAVQLWLSWLLKSASMRLRKSRL